MRVLVTGGAGYIGSVLCERLVRAGHHVAVLDIGWWGLGHLEREHGPHEIIEGNVRDVTVKDVHGFDVVIHLAGLSNDPTADFAPDLNWKLNAEASSRLAGACAEYGARLIFASTHSLYGQPELVANEQTPINPIGPYPDSKAAAEHSIRGALGDDSVILRLGTIWGVSPRMRYDLVVNTFARDALTRGALRLDGGGADWRPMVHVQDVARAMEWALTGPTGTFNIAHNNYRVVDLAHRVADAVEALYGERVEYEDAPPRSRSRSQRVDRMNATLAGFKTERRVSIKGGLAGAPGDHA
jgi:nucleoside-diphosphate-sugar epimerase